MNITFSYVELFCCKIKECYQSSVIDISLVAIRLAFSCLLDQGFIKQVILYEKCCITFTV